jgi:hypothetical protein
LNEIGAKLGVGRQEMKYFEENPAQEIAGFKAKAGFSAAC